MAKKRAPGGGRKPSPNTPRAQLTVRMPDDLRAELVAAGNERGRPGWTLTDELLYRLRNSFNRERDERRDPAVRAICFLISEIAKGLQRDAAIMLKDRAPKLHRDPFMFQAFRAGVLQLLDEIAPRGEPRSPFAGLKSESGFLQNLIELYETPENAGRYAANFICLALWQGPLSLSPEQREANERFNALGDPYGILKDWDRMSYGIANAYRDLERDQAEQGGNNG